MTIFHSSSFEKQITPVTNPSVRLFSDIADAELLISYASQAGIAIPAKDVSNVIAAKTAFGEDTMDNSIEMNFYTSYAAISKTLGKVTAATIRDCSSFRTRMRLIFNWVMAMGLTLLVACISLISLVLNETNKIISNNIAQAQEISSRLRYDLPVTNSDVGREPCDISDDVANAMPKMEINQEKIASLQRFSELIRDIHSSAIKLNFPIAYIWDSECNPIPGCEEIKHELSLAETAPGSAELREIRSSNNEKSRARLEISPQFRFPYKEIVCKISTYQAVRNFGTNVSNNYSSIFAAISLSVLPILYAILGAFAFRLRSFSDTIKKRTFHPSYADSARMITAIIAGAVCSIISLQYNSNISSLSPLGIAFAAGYGVEVFFRTLDSIVNRFNKKPVR